MSCHSFLSTALLFKHCCHTYRQGMSLKLIIISFQENGIMERCDEGAVNLSSGRETTERSSMKDEEVKVPPQFPPSSHTPQHNIPPSSPTYPTQYPSQLTYPPTQYHFSLHRNHWIFFLISFFEQSVTYK